MSDKTSRPSPLLVVPRPGGDIIIRQFQTKDAEQVHALLVEGLVYGPESPRNVALWRNLRSRISCLAYFGWTVGLSSCFWSTNHVVRIAGGVLVLCATALFIYRRYSITKLFVHFCAIARATDMADIVRTYEVPVTVSADGIKPPQGPSAFWVAVIESPDKSTSEIVGYLGLDYHANPDPSSAELRRMIVSGRYRRRRIASLLMSAALAHACLHKPLLTSLELETTEFQPGARRLYENLGFSLVGTHIMRISPVFTITVTRLRRNI
ncbi:acyl-CoA N-acyltransferase [Mycena sanguinolenta]|nr:acyl-CoA N-acyltransferase [Mycena sanguinolenta]